METYSDNKKWMTPLINCEGFLFRHEENWNTRPMQLKSIKSSVRISTDPYIKRTYIEKQYNTWLEGIGHPLFI